MKTQTPNTDGNWLYKETATEVLFRKIVYLPDDAELWEECTNEYKVSWEEEHLPKEVEQVEELEPSKT